MTWALLLVVLVSERDLRSPATIALRNAAQEVLGSAVEVRLQSYTKTPSDLQLVEQARDASAVAEVTWSDEKRQHAFVHCYVTEWQRFVNRELVFDAADELQERGRMLGFSVASMLPEEAQRAPDAGPTAKAPVETRPAVHEDRLSAVEPGPRRARVAIDTSGLVAFGLGNPGGGVGVGIAGQWLFLNPFSLRVATGARYGSVDVARAKATYFFVGLGMGFQYSRDPRSRFNLGARFDALLTANALRRDNADGEPPQSQTRYQPAADLLVDGACYLWTDTALIAAAGMQLSLGHSDVVVQGKELADIAQLRIVSELGIRSRF